MTKPEPRLYVEDHSGIFMIHVNLDGLDARPFIKTMLEDIDRNHVWDGEVDGWVALEIPSMDHLRAGVIHAEGKAQVFVQIEAEYDELDGTKPCSSELTLDMILTIAKATKTMKAMIEKSSAILH